MTSSTALPKLAFCVDPFIESEIKHASLTSENKLNILNGGIRILKYKNENLRQHAWRSFVRVFRGPCGCPLRQFGKHALLKNFTKMNLQKSLAVYSTVEMSIPPVIGSKIIIIMPGEYTTFTRNLV